MDAGLTRRQALERAGALGGAALALPGLSALLAACGDTEPSGTADALRIAVSSDTQTLDPHTAFFPRSTEMATNLFETFVAAVPEERDGQLVGDWFEAKPAFAETVDFSDRKDRVVITIPKGRTFPSGNPVTMDDVMYSFRRLAEVGIGGFVYSTASIDPKRGVKRVDDRTIEIRASRPVPYLLAILCEPHVALWDSREMKKHATRDDPWSTEWTTKNVAPSGPYVVDRVVSGTRTELSANPSFERYRPGFKQVLLRVIPSVADRVSLLRRGDVDFAQDLPKQNINELKGSKEVDVLSFPSIDQLYVAMNPNRGPFQSKELRQAVNHAIPYDQILENVYFGQARRMRSILPEDAPTFDTTLAYYRHDPEKAKALARASGATPVKVELAFDTAQPEHQPVAAIVQSALRPLGIDVTLRPTESAPFSEGKAKRRFPFFIDQILFWINDPAYILDLVASSKGAVNLASYRNPRVDALIERGKDTLKSEAREAAFGEVQRILLDAAIWAPIAHPNFNVAMRKTVTDYAVYPSHLTYYGDLKPAG